MWTARHLITDTRKFVDHAAFTRGPRGMHWLTAQGLLVITRYSLVDNVDAARRGGAGWVPGGSNELRPLDFHIYNLFVG
jgi:hypothetical protein